MTNLVNDDLLTDQEIRDFLTIDCGISDEDIKRILDNEDKIRQTGQLAGTQIFLSSDELDRVFGIMKDIVGQGSSGSDSDYDRAMSII